MRCLGFAITVFWAVCLYALLGTTQQKAIPINVGYSSISGSQAILRVTRHAGILQKNRLDASLVLIASGSGIIQALIAGDLPVAVVGGEPAVANGSSLATHGSYPFVSPDSGEKNRGSFRLKGATDARFAGIDRRLARQRPIENS